jgi:YD repeat-containing protein
MKMSTYNSKCELLEQRDALGQITTYTYDDNGNRTSITDTANRTTIIITTRLITWFQLLTLLAEPQ